MTKYVKAKKYLRIIVPIMIVVGAIFVPKVDHRGQDHTLGLSVQKPAANPLRVSPSGERMFTNVNSGSLQAANVPERSTTSASLSPQLAEPNYCAPGETPYIDGCINR